MLDISTQLLQRLQPAFDSIEVSSDPVLRLSERADYQVNGVLALAKRLRKNPFELAGEIVAGADLDGVCEKVDVSGPGFINLTLSTQFIASQLFEMMHDERLGVTTVSSENSVEATGEPIRVVVDYSGPNVAKEMHVGHLRTTVIGDALCRILSFVGYSVVRENHIGDWGTPFGMLIEHLVDMGEEKGAHELSVGDLDGFYRAARVCFDADEEFAERSRRRVVLLQRGDPETVRLWQLLVAESVRYFDDVYAKLGVLLVDDDIVGESYYNSKLDDVVSILGDKGLIVEDNGALCVFPEGFYNRSGDPLPLIIRKSDGGYGYAATDLAAIWDRAERLRARRILYVVGSAQSQHLQMCFAVAKLVGWLNDSVEAVHVSFGNILGSDNKVFKTRSGERIKLVDLLDEAIERGAIAIAKRSNPIPDETTSLGNRDTARIVGIGAVKYADLSTERTRDYVFDWERMLGFEGNTAAYLQYAHARICSIFRRSGLESYDPTSVKVLDQSVIHERSLALKLLGYGEAINSTLESYSPSKLCAYLFELSSTFTDFFEHCKVLVDDPAVRDKRLALCGLTRSVLAHGLDLLGLEAPSQM